MAGSLRRFLPPENAPHRRGRLRLLTTLPVFVGYVGWVVAQNGPAKSWPLVLAPLALIVSSTKLRIIGQVAKSPFA